MNTARKYEFHWDLLGDIALGRPNLGHTTRLEIYRLMQFTLRDVIEQRLGSQATDEIFYRAGFNAGQAFYRHYLTGETSFDAFIRQLQMLMQEFRIGILRVEEADLQRGELTLTISEDMDCSGLPESDYEICVYDEGFIAALLESFTGVRFTVKEIDCWCTGDRTCRFKARAQ